MNGSVFGLGVGATAEAVSRGELTAAAVVDHTLERIARYGEQLNCFTSVFETRARERAVALDSALAAGERAGPLAGVPFAVKNLFDVKGEVTRAGAALTAADAPAARDAVLIQRLERAGAILVGALNMGEFAYDFTGENAHFGACRNPWDPERMSGGSSSGSGAALAARLLPLTLGTDTNGSIRVPSALCGTFGLKPTYGRLSRTGSYPFCDSLDHVGPMANSARDLALAYDQLQGPPAGDPTVPARPPDAASDALAQPLTGLRVGVVHDGYFATEGATAAAVTATAAALQDLGCRVESTTVPLVAEGRSAAFLITNAEGAALHRERLQTAPEAFDPDTRDRFLAGALMPASWYLRAQAVRRRYARAVAVLFDHVDLLVAPATPCVAPRLGTKTLTHRGETVPLRANLGLFTQPFSAIGLPVVCVPHCPSEPGPGTGLLPVGVQLIAAPWREVLCLRVALALEEAGAAGTTVPAGFGA